MLLKAQNMNMCRIPRTTSRFWETLLKFHSDNNKNLVSLAKYHSCNQSLRALELPFYKTFITSVPKCFDSLKYHHLLFHFIALYPSSPLLKSILSKDNGGSVFASFGCKWGSSNKTIIFSNKQWHCCCCCCCCKDEQLNKVHLNESLLICWDNCHLIFLFCLKNYSDLNGLLQK